MTFARKLTVLSLIGMLTFVAIDYVRGGWDGLFPMPFLGLFTVVLANLVVFGFFGKAE